MTSHPAPDLIPLTRAQSLAEQAYQRIREGIATGLFQAGERVTERGLAARLDVSPTPVREALRRLEQEGLIERVSARQLRVVEHSPAAVRELMLTGAALRAMEARFATHKITDAALDRMTALLDTGDRTDYPSVARDFDREIERAADNPTLRGLITSLSVVGKETPNRPVESTRDLAERRLILAALRSRDPDAVEQAFRRHATEQLLDDPAR